MSDHEPLIRGIYDSPPEPRPLTGKAMLLPLLRADANAGDVRRAVERIEAVARALPSTPTDPRPIETKPETTTALAWVLAERNMQRERYGDDERLSDEEWDGLIRAYLHKAASDKRAIRLIQVAALAVAAWEDNRDD